MNILVIAPHADDEIIGVGGTIAKRIDEGNDICVCVVTRGVEPLYSEKYMQQLRQETLKCHEFMGVKKTFFLEFPSVILEEQHRYEINQKLVDVIKEIRPEEVFIPHVGDMQKDHQVVAECSMVALRPKYCFAPHKIYAYETLSETGWNTPNIQNEFIPTSFVDISDYLDNKMHALSLFESQVAEFPNARSLEAVKALAMYRGALMNMRAAEAFSIIREIR